MNQTQKKTRSVKFAFILLLLLSAVLMASFASAGAEGGSTPISEAVFPDASFRQYVSYSFDADGNGSLSEDEIFGVESINLSQNQACINNTTTLQGIEVFSNLKHLTAPGMKKLDGVLDLSANNLLKEVRMSTPMPASQATASVDGVILGYQPNLTHFIMTNRWELTALDLSSCPALSELNVDGCALSSLDLSHCPALKTLSAAFTKLTALDLSQNQQLLSLNFHHNTELNSLSLAGLSDLHQLSVQYTPIPVLDISPCPYLLALLENPAYYKDMGDRHLYATSPDSTADHLFLSKTTLLQTEAGQVFTTLTLPVSLNKIDVEAFAGIAADIVKVPQGCASIGSRAFADCPNLKLIYVSENTSLADDALSGCTYAYIVRYSS